MNLLIDRFIDWAKNKRATLDSRDGIECSLIVDEIQSQDPSARLDIDTENIISSIAIWTTGEIHIEALDAKTGKRIYNKLETLNEEVDFDSTFSEFFSWLGSTLLE